MKDLDESQNYIESKIDHIIETTAATAAEKVEDKLADQYVKAEYLLMMLKPTSAQTVTLVAADLAPKLDLLTAKIDENNLAMDGVDRKIKTVEEHLEMVKEYAMQTRHEFMEYCAGSDDDEEDGASDAYSDDD